MEDFYYAGGVPALLTEIAPLLHLDALTVTGQSLGANIAGVRTHNHEVIKSLDTPLDPEGGLAVLRS